jgi:hypothetical protein
MKNQQLTESQIINIERTAKVWKDTRNEKTNSRRTIYEIQEHEKYICIIKQDGEYKRYITGQNPLSILLSL